MFTEVAFTLFKHSNKSITKILHHVIPLTTHEIKHGGGNHSRPYQLSWPTVKWVRGWSNSSNSCAFFFSNPNVVRLGEHDYSSTADDAQHEDFTVIEKVIYPNYTFPEAHHDLALLKLDKKVVLRVSVIGQDQFFVQFFSSFGFVGRWLLTRQCTLKIL